MIKTSLKRLSEMLKRSESPADGLPPVPRGVNDALLWRLSQGHIKPPAPAKMPTMGREGFETKYRDAG
jgi:hypothetical protein